MPFKSKAQARKFAMLERDGKLPSGTYAHWKSVTDDFDNLPEHFEKDAGLMSKALGTAAIVLSMAGAAQQAGNTARAVFGGNGIPVAPVTSAPPIASAIAKVKEEETRKERRKRKPKKSSGRLYFDDNESKVMLKRLRTMRKVASIEKDADLPPWARKIAATTSMIASLHGSVGAADAAADSAAAAIQRGGWKKITDSSIEAGPMSEASHAYLATKPARDTVAIPQDKWHKMIAAMSATGRRMDSTIARRQQFDTSNHISQMTNEQLRNLVAANAGSIR